MKKINYNKGRFTIANSELVKEDWSWEDFKEWYMYNNMCEDESEVPDADSNEYYDWCCEENQFSWECDLENIKHEKRYQIPVVIEGGFRSVRYADFYGSGRKQIVPVVCDSVYEAVMYIISNAQPYETKITYDDGKIVAECYDHDGDYYFEIKALSKKGVEKNENMYDRSYFPDIQDYHKKRLQYLYA